MDEEYINQLVTEWDDVYKKGQLSLWVLLALTDGRKYAAQISECMGHMTNGSFDVKEQSLYRALRRFEAMKLVVVTKEASPVSGTKRKYFQLTPIGEAVLSRFVQLHIAPLQNPRVVALLDSLIKENR